ncbi:hypothetical protein P1J78_02370 [Psychromarinibacter sp. C21-152]|uniref:YHS domain-containing protein n=1 Tax=Psychromarinibacter sediminicola TaxID=3033385 RepID=A0AAE3NPG1_9RHOB|nr:hypothetical protein [Psychromarinibacter sediminicola]MDF0599566.1 hypothetical protein [Psychromarinibacter sediminicola]
MRGPGFVAVAALIFALPAGAAEHRQTVEVTPLDHALPLGFAEQLPAGVTPADVFVSEDGCYYYRKDGQYFLLDCVG